jgi:hypothetical protein
MAAVEDWRHKIRTCWLSACQNLTSMPCIETSRTFLEADFCAEDVRSAMAFESAQLRIASATLVGADHDIALSKISCNRQTSANGCTKQYGADKTRNQKARVKEIITAANRAES